MITALRANHGMNALWLIYALLAGFILMLPGCAKTVTVPGPTVEVKVPVPVPCQIEQVPASQRPTLPADAGIFDATKTALADRRQLMAEIERLRAANRNPCPVR